MIHLPSVRTGKSAEENLFDILKNDRNKRAYISTKLSDFSKIMNIIIKNNKEDKKLLKYLLKMHKDTCVKNIRESKLNQDQVDHLSNALKTRYKIKIRELKLPLN